MGAHAPQALIVGFTVDYLRIELCNGFNIKSLPADHWLNDGNRLIVASGAVTSLFGLGVSLCFREGERTSAQRAVALAAVMQMPDDLAAARSPLALDHELPEFQGLEYDPAACWLVLRRAAELALLPKPACTAHTHPERAS